MLFCNTLAINIETNEHTLAPGVCYLLGRVAVLVGLTRALLTRDASIELVSS
jgi:hypothetical protein